MHQHHEPPPRQVDQEATGHEQPSGHHSDHHTEMVKDFRRRFWISLALSVPVLALSPMIQEFLGIGVSLDFEGDSLLLFGLSTAVFLYGGWPFLTGLYRELADHNPGMMTLIGVAIGTAYFYSAAVVFGLPGKVFFWELATLIVVMLLGHWIEMRSVLGASRALQKLAELLPSDAHRLDEAGEVHDVPVADLKNGDILVIRPGEKVPADGEVTDGSSSLNEALLTGESNPVAKSSGDEVFGGSVNGEGSLNIRVLKTGSESYLSQVVDLVERAQNSRSRTQNLADRAARWLTIVALSSGAITLFVWLVVMDRDFTFALARAVTVMVIACPHALGLAIPLVVAVSTSLSAKHGLLIRDRSAFERARNLDVVVFDKTGTLTEGRFGVVSVSVRSADYSRDAVLSTAASVEQYSEHPIARAIVTSLPESRSIPKAVDFESITGKGARATVDGKVVIVASPGYLQENDIHLPEPLSNSESDAVATGDLDGYGETIVFVIVEDHVIGSIALADLIRSESKDAVRRLKNSGVRVMMLTGDNEKVAEWVSREIGLDDYFAGVLPDKKADRIIELQKSGLTVAMVGDGVNDAPALAQADVGIAIGAGTDVAVEAADIVLVRSDPSDVASIVEYSAATYRKMIQNLWWAAGYNIVAIPLAAGVLYGFGILLNPAVGAALMSLSTVIVAVNARFLKVGSNDPG